MKGKKAQGLSMQTIVLAAIAVFVLVVVILIFSGQIGRIFKGGVSPIVDKLGEQACVVQAGLGGNINKCCSDLYKDVKDSTEKDDLVRGCINTTQEIS